MRDRRSDGLIDEPTDGPMDGLSDGWTSGGMDRRDLAEGEAEVEVEAEAEWSFAICSVAFIYKDKRIEQF